MTCRLGTAIATLLLLSISGISKSSSDENSDESGTPPTYFQYKVKALNTALYYILQALHDDLTAGLEVDISFLNRINVIINKIKSFYGKVDQTNALMLGELLKVFPGYLVNKMEEAGLNFTEYTVMPTTDSLETDGTSEDGDADSESSADSTERPSSSESVDSVDSNE